MSFSLYVIQDLLELEAKFQATPIKSAFKAYENLTTLDPKQFKPLAEHPKIYPNSWAPIMIMTKGKRQLRPMRYRLRPGWAKEDLPSKYRMFTARLDSLTEKKMWSRVFMKNHGVLVYRSFLEWVEDPTTGEKRLLSFRPTHQEFICSPVIFDKGKIHEGKDDFFSFALITHDSPPDILELGYDRCPIFLSPEQIDIWLNPKQISREVMMEALLIKSEIKLDYKKSCLVHVIRLFLAFFNALVTNMSLFFAVLSGVLYGGLGLFGMNLLKAGFSVNSMLFWRFAISTLVFLPWVFVSKQFSLSKHLHSACIATLLGAVFYASSSGFYFVACATMGTGLAMVVFFSYPIAVALLSLLLYGVTITRGTAISLILIVVGCAFIASGNGFTFDWWGLGAALLSALGYAFYILWSKKVSESLSPVINTFFVSLGNAVSFLVMTLLLNELNPLPSSLSDWENILVLGFFCTALPILLFILAMKQISPTNMSIISVLEPLTTLLVGVLVLQESVTGHQAFGALLILCSALICILEKKPQPSLQAID